MPRTKRSSACSALIRQPTGKKRKHGGVSSVFENNNYILDVLNYHILLWMTEVIGMDVQEEGDSAINSTAFIRTLSNGVFLADLANALKAGSVQCVHTKDVHTQKAFQAANIAGFICFAKADAKLESSSVFEQRDLETGTENSYQAVFSTLFLLAVQAKEKFEKPALDLEKVATSAAKYFKTKVQEDLQVMAKKADLSKPAEIRKVCFSLAPKESSNHPSTVNPAQIQNDKNYILPCKDLLKLSMWFGLGVLC